MAVSYLSQAVLLFFLLYHVFGLVTSVKDPTIVSTKQGLVQGKREDVQNSNGQSKTVYKFLGVPYAQNPSGSLRFKRPQSLTKKRSASYDATYYRPICMQTLYYKDSIKRAWPAFEMSEDCLYLNIYTPSTNCKTRYPVLVHIHGGSYVDGTPVRDISPGEYLPQRDVVLVGVQYRLGPYGFFSTGDSDVPGNMGLLDQVEALKWIQENIGGFCGDKNSVTLLGESAGGASVSLHYLSPLSKGLFHRGIAVSGVAFCPFALQPKSIVVEASKTLIKNIDCERKNSGLTVKCLRSKSGKDIDEANKDFLKVQPFVDNYFLPDEPKNLMKEGKFQKLPLMSGFVPDEGIVPFLPTAKLGNISEFRDYFDKHFFQTYLQLPKDQASVAFNALVFQYTPWDNFRYQYFRKKTIEMLGDYFFTAPTLALLNSHSDQGARTYMFEFAHRSQHHPKPQWMGVPHEDTTAYKFGLPLLKSNPSNLKFDADDRDVSDMMVTLFTNFAKHGNPTPSPVKGVKWEPFDSSKKAYLKIMRRPFRVEKYLPQRMAFWNNYFPTLVQLKSCGQGKKSETAKPITASRAETKTSLAVVGGASNLDKIRW